MKALDWVFKGMVMLMNDVCYFSLFMIIPMSLLWETQNWRLHMRRECREPFPRHRLQRKPRVSDPGMHHGTCITHVPRCLSGSLTRGGGENVPGIPCAYATRNFTYLARGICYTTWMPYIWLYKERLFCKITHFFLLCTKQLQDVYKRTREYLSALFCVAQGFYAFIVWF